MAVLRGMKSLCAEDNELNAEILDAGMNAHVAKPLDVAALERVLRALKKGSI